MASAFSYPISQGYGPTNEPLDGPYRGAAHFNKGFDYAAPAGTTVPAMVGGVVIQAGPGNDGWGISVKIKDAKGNIHNYGHLGSVNVQVGATVSAGATIGAVGNTGASTGPHLSYDVLSANGEYIDPAPFVGGSTVANPIPYGTGGQTTVNPDVPPSPGGGTLTDSGQSAADWKKAATLGAVSVRSQGGKTYLIDTSTGAFKEIVGLASGPDSAANLQTFTASGHVYIFNPDTGKITDTGIGSAAPTNQQAVTVNGHVYSFNPATGTLTDTGVGGPTPPNLAAGTTNSGMPFVFNPQTGQFSGPDGKPITDPSYFTQNSDLVKKQIEQITANIALAQKQLDNAIRAQDFNEYQYATTRLDNIARDANQFNIAIAGLSQTRELAGLNAQLQVATTNATLLAQSARDEAQMRFQSVESDRMRAFQAGEGIANRSLSAATSKAQFGLQKAQILDQRKAAALAAAKQFGELISSTDPNAFRAFLVAGGGVIANALAGGNTAQSDLANLPAARTLRTLATPPEDIPDFQWTEPTNQALNMPPAVIPHTPAPQIAIPPGFNNPTPLPTLAQPPPVTPFQPHTNPAPTAPPPGTSPAPPTAPGTPGSHIGVPIGDIHPNWNLITTGSGGDFDVSNVDPQLEVWDAARNQRITAGMLHAGTPYWFKAPANWTVPHAAAGGTFGGFQNAVITGDSPNGRPTGHEELSLSNGPQMVVPLNEQGQRAAGIDPQQGQALRDQYLGTRPDAQPLFGMGLPVFPGGYSETAAPVDPAAVAAVQAQRAMLWGGGGQMGGMAASQPGIGSMMPLTKPPVVLGQPGGQPGPVLDGSGQGGGIQYGAGPQFKGLGAQSDMPPVQVIFNPAKGNAEQAVAQVQPLATPPPLGSGKTAPVIDARQTRVAQFVPRLTNRAGLSQPPSILGGQEPQWQYPHAAAGGIYDIAQQAMNTAIAPEDLAYLNIVRQLRDTTPYPHLNQFAANFMQSTSPTIRELYFKGQQARYGIPVQDSMWEQQRFQPYGLSRGGLRVAV